MASVTQSNLTIDTLGLPYCYLPPHRPHIHGMPVEILMRTFQSLGSRQVENTWVLTVSQTCARWRNIAFSMPELWTCITARHPQLVEMHLQLSRTQQIKVAIPSDIRDSHAAVINLQLKDHKQRIATLIIHLPLGPTISLAKFMEPLLDGCRKTLVGFWCDEKSELLSIPFEVPNSTNTRIGPWEALDMYHCILPLNMCFFRGLRLLRMEYQGHTRPIILWEDPLQRALGSLADVLRGCPQLQELYLGYFWMPFCRNTTVLSLPCLSVLSLRDDMPSGIFCHVMRWVKIPKTCRIFVKCDHVEDSSALRKSPLFPLTFLEQSSETIPSSPPLGLLAIRRLKFLFTLDRRCRVFGTSDSNKPLFCLEIGSSPPAKTTRKLKKDLLMHFVRRMGELQLPIISLDVCCEVAWIEKRTWRRAFQYLPKLERLRINNIDEERRGLDELNLLLALQAHPRVDRKGDVRCTELQTLVFEGLVIGVRFKPILVQVLKSRSGTCSPLTDAILLRCQSLFTRPLHEKFGIDPSGSTGKLRIPLPLWLGSMEMKRFQLLPKAERIRNFRRTQVEPLDD